MIVLAAAIVLTLNNTGIINMANDAFVTTDLAQVKHLATVKWSEAYLNEGYRENRPRKICQRELAKR